jgi:hypothetical protein
MTTSSSMRVKARKNALARFGIEDVNAGFIKVEMGN